MMMMTTAEYRDEVDTFAGTLSAVKSCVNFEERQAAMERVQRGWKRLALLEQPKRLPKPVVDRCNRLLTQAATMLNNWLVDVESGCAEAPKPATPPPAKAMADTMRFCNIMRSKGVTV